MKQFFPIQAKTNGPVSGSKKGHRESYPIQGQSKEKESTPGISNIPTQSKHTERMGYSLSRIPIFPPTSDDVFMPETGQSGTLNRKNNTGLPDTLKDGIEILSGMLMDDVKVHYHSSKPAQVQALAYTRGADIHVGSGQEKHLAHEAWHVVQQKQGRVKPTLRTMGVVINDEQALEREAEVMGETAAQGRFWHTEASKEAVSVSSQSSLPIQGYFKHNEEDLTEESWEVKHVLSYIDDEDDEEKKKAFLKDLNSKAPRILLNWVERNFEGKIKEKIRKELSEGEGKVGPMKQGRVIAKGGGQGAAKEKKGKKEQIEGEEEGEQMEQEEEKKSVGRVTRSQSEKTVEEREPKKGQERGRDWLWVAAHPINVKSGRNLVEVPSHPVHKKHVAHPSKQIFRGSYTLVTSDKDQPYIFSKNEGEWNPNDEEHTEPQYFRWAQSHIAKDLKSHKNVIAVILEVNQTNTPCSQEGCRPKVLDEWLEIGTSLSGGRKILSIVRMSAYQMYHQAPTVGLTTFEAKEMERKGTKVPTISAPTVVHKFPDQHTAL